MPLVNDPESPPPVDPAPSTISATITDVPYKNALVDYKVTPHSALLTHIEGSSWTVDYYSQTLGGNTELGPFELNEPSVYQQYLLIKQYELKLQGALSQSQDDQTHEFTVSGTAVTYPFMTPNYGDMFIADIGDGRVGMFTVSSVPRRLTIFKEACFEITFTLVTYVDQGVIDSIDACVVKTTHFVKDFLTHGQNPIIADVDVVTKEQCETAIRELVNRWLTRFYSRESRTILVPGQVSATYDPYVVKAMLRVLDRNEHPLVARIREINCQGLPQTDDYLLWNTLLNIDTPTALIRQKVILIDTGFFTNEVLFDGVAHSNIGRVVYPDADNDNVDKDYAMDPPISGVPYRDLADIDENLVDLYQYRIAGGFDDPGTPVDPDITVESVPVIRKVLFDDYYVLSQAFYDQAPTGQSILELQVSAYVNNKALNKDQIFAVYRDINDWGRLELFYYIPLLIILMKTLIRRF